MVFAGSLMEVVSFYNSSRQSWCMIWVVCGSLPLHTRVKSSANNSPMTWFAIRNRDAVKSALTSMILMDRKLLIKLRIFSLRP